jgi:thiamine biosynthesis lipoprotein
MKKNHKPVKLGRIILYGAVPLVILVLLLVWYLKKDTVTVSDSRLTLGTVVEITVIGKDKVRLEKALGAAFARISEIEKVTDRFTADSEITHVNRRKGPGPIPVSADMLEMLRISRRVADLTGGAFDITITPVFDLWGFDIGGRLPKPEEIARHLGQVDYHKISLDETHKTLTVTDPAVRLNLDGIAQGYAARAAREVLRRFGVTGGVINVSGDMAIIGDKAGKPWRIGVQDPRNGKKLVAVIKAEDTAIVTSGDYERCFFVDGVRYHHIIDPHTGYPARRCASVTVVTEDPAVADALSTSIFVLGPEKGIELAERLKTVDVLIVADDGKVSFTPGLGPIIELVK